VREEIEVEDWQEKVGGGQMEPVRSQVREESSEGGSVVLAIMAPMGFSSYCTLKLLFPRVTVLPQV
jgi:putative hemolysin